MPVSSIDELNPNGSYTYQDYLSWTFPERVELYHGKPFQLSPAPSSRHQEVSQRLSGELYIHFKKSDCKVFAAPFDVRLPIVNKRGEANTVVQPDVCVVCESSKIDKQGCNGAPDLVVEILSPGNRSKEVREKFSLYQEAGVAEYWVVHPLDETVYIFVLDGTGKYIGLQPLTSEDRLVSTTLPALEIDLSDVFS